MAQISYRDWVFDCDPAKTRRAYEEIIAGGSIHVYGSLRGRAIAGLTGNNRARIFCRRLEAELLAIDGVYQTADDMNAALRGRPVQAWLAGEAMMLATFD